MKRRSRVCAFFAALTLCVSMLLIPVTAQAASEINYQEAKKGVVRIYYVDSFDNPTTDWSGSGFGIGKIGKETDIFVTNRHVVFDENTGKIVDTVYIPIEDGAIQFIYDGMGYFDHVNVDWDRVVRCKVLYPTDDDPAFPDIAILQAERPVEGRIALPLKSSFEVEDGTQIYAIGYPGSSDLTEGFREEEQSYVEDYKASIASSTITNGIVARSTRFFSANDTYVFHHTAHINHGNSGGPLVLSDGTVVGVNTYGITYEDSSVSEYSLAVYIDYAMNKLDELGIEYNVTSSGWFLYLWIGIAVLVVAAGIITILLVRKKNKNTAPKPEQYRLQGMSGVFHDKRVKIPGMLRIGRNPAENDLIYPSTTPGISGRHCRLFFEDNKLYLEDAGSSYGTYINGVKLQPGQRWELKAGDSFYLVEPANSFRIEVTAEK